MGMFDTVLFRCPDCQEVIEEQTKAGSCTLQYIRADEAPTDLAIYLIGDKVSCPACNKQWRISTKNPPPDVTPLELVEDDD